VLFMAAVGMGVDTAGWHPGSEKFVASISWYGVEAEGVREVDGAAAQQHGHFDFDLGAFGISWDMPASASNRPPLAGSTIAFSCASHVQEGLY
jgi:hypothetical protein